jgi:hypothetical protein
MPKRKIEVGDELMIRSTVTAVWTDGHLTVHVSSAGLKITLPDDSDVVATVKKPARSSTKRRKLPTRVYR